MDEINNQRKQIYNNLLKKGTAYICQELENRKFNKIFVNDCRIIAHMTHLIPPLLFLDKPDKGDEYFLNSVLPNFFIFSKKKKSFRAFEMLNLLTQLSRLLNQNTDLKIKIPDGFK